MIFFAIEMNSSWHNIYYNEFKGEVPEFETLEIPCAHYPNKEDLTFELSCKNNGNTLILCTDRTMVYSLEKRFLDAGKNVFATLYGRDYKKEAELLKLNQYEIILGTIGRLSKLNLALSKLKLLIVLNYDEIDRYGFADSYELLMKTIPKSESTIYFTCEENTYYDEILNHEIDLRNERRIVSLESASEAYDKIRKIYETENIMFSLIFCKSAADASDLINKMNADLFPLYVISGKNMSLNDMRARDALIAKYRVYICIRDEIPEAMYFPVGGIVINYLHSPPEDVYRKRCARLCLGGINKNITYDIV